MDVRMTVTQENTRSYPMHSHDMLEMMCYISGNGVLRTSEGDYEFKEGTVIAVPPGIVHASHSEDSFVNICVHANTTVPGRHIHYIKESTAHQRSLFELLRDLYFTGNGYENTIMLLVMALKELVYLPVEEKREDVDIKVRNVYEKIVLEFQNADFDLSGIISDTGYTDDYFREKFRSCYGITPKAHLDTLRMDYATSLMKSNDTKKLEVSQIARMCGYKDALYFSKKFKNIYGCSPKKYIDEQLG